MKTRIRLIVLITVVAACAAVAGLYFTGVIGGSSGPVKKVHVEPVSLTEPFIINLADTASVHLVKLGLSLQVADMSSADRSSFSGSGAADAGAPTGASHLATYAPIRDAVIDTVSQFTSAELSTADGKSQLKAELLRAFAQVEAKDRHNEGAGAKHDPTIAPFKITDVYFSELAVQ